MGERRGLTLDDEGCFTASGPRGAHRVTCDSFEFSGRWVVTGPCGHDGRKVSRHDDLDSALALAASSAGLGAAFGVGLPCGQAFIRPGRVAAERVLASLGYVVAQCIRAYGVVEADADATHDDVRHDLLERLRGTSLTLGSVDPVPSHGRGSAWCFDLSLPFEGPVDPEAASGFVERETADLGIAFVKSTEVTPLSPVTPHRASVIELRPMFVAA